MPAHWLNRRPDKELARSLKLEIAAQEAEIARLGRLDVMTLTVAVTFQSDSGDLPTFYATELPLDPKHQRNNVPDSLFAYFAEKPANLSLARSIPLIVQAPDGANGLDVLTDFEALHDLILSPPQSPPLLSLADALKLGDASTADWRSVALVLSQGNDGLVPLPDA